MPDIVRRLVSGNKARYKDPALDLELDLAYITDRIIVMGYPAAGLEGLYRNRREDAKKFLDHRHGRSYWVFNFCPVRENAYPAEVFEGRVSRYPFPDHHAPPLAILPLIAREIGAWLEGAPERVAVLHCKAGKGRSGTMACAYLLTLADLPRPPGATNVEENAKQRAEDLMNIMPADVDGSDAAYSPASDPIKHELSVASRESAPSTASLDDVLQLHTAGRMKRPSSPGAKLTHGVSIPSQRRWLYYWSLLLARTGPRAFWARDDVRAPPPPRVRLTRLVLRMRELSGVKANLLRAANVLLDRAGRGRAGGAAVWASLARYDDALVGTLEDWERDTRAGDGSLGVCGGPVSDGGDAFGDARWDAGKMVRCFARLGAVDGRACADKDGTAVEYVLRPLSGDGWAVAKSTREYDEGGAGIECEHGSTLGSSSDGVVLDANREVRVKLYMGQVFMGWFWFIPTFHMSPSNKAETTLRLSRQEVDFPLGIGSHVVDVTASLRWCSSEAAVACSPLSTTAAGDS